MLWLNGQDFSDEINYFDPPITTDDAQQDTLNMLTHLKLKQFHIYHKTRCLEWCVVPTTYALRT